MPWISSKNTLEAFDNSITPVPALTEQHCRIAPATSKNSGMYMYGT